MDIRVKKTKRAIQKAFVALLREKPIEKITVKEIAERAEINKTTFYSHYETLDALTAEMERQTVQLAVTCNSYAECKDCKIGGFCGGGCQLSHQIDFKKCCTYEEEVFSHFMKTLFIPYIKSKYNEVNQNERKAENRCT